MIILVPYFGNKGRFRSLIDKWVSAKKASGCNAAWFALSNTHGSYSFPTAMVDVSPFEKAIYPDQAFDFKGGLVCAALMRFKEELLVLDADAVLLRDPSLVLSAFKDCPIAMPVDGGAIMHGREAKLEAPYSAVRKMCAGVMWFGAENNRNDRAALVMAYVHAHQQLMDMVKLPWAPPLRHLVEQHAWSIVCHNMHGRVLPNSLNWAPHFLGENKEAIINHYYGLEKWAS